MDSSRSVTNRKNRSRSKSQERKVAAFLGARRTPLSGIGSGHTHGDIIDDVFYVEAKGASGPKSSNGWVWRLLSDAERGLYQNVAAMHGLAGATELLHTSALYDTTCYVLGAGEYPKAMMVLWKDTCEKAEAEGKQPLLALFVKNRKGFWFFGSEDTMDLVRERRRKVIRGKDEGEKGTADV